MIHPILSQSDGERVIIMFQARRVFAYLFCSFELNYLNTRFKIRGKRKYNNLMCLGFFFFNLRVGYRISLSQLTKKKKKFVVDQGILDFNSLTQTK